MIDAVRDRTEEEILDLITWLPEGSATSAMKESGGNKSKALAQFGWTSVHELNLALINLSSYQSYVLTQAHTEKKVPVPKPVIGPNGKKPSKGTDANAIARRLLDAQKGGP